MKVVLELQDQPSNIKRVTVCHDIVIGRGSECNLRLSAPQVSRRHCFLRVGADAASITDLESSNGTFVNGKKIAPGKRYLLKDGMKISVGPIQFVTRVQSEMVATDLPVNEKLDDSIVTSEDEVVADPVPPVDRGIPTITDVASLADGPALEEMKFSVEQAGDSAEADEPTADYPSSDGLLSPARKQQAAPQEELLDSQAEIIDLGKDKSSIGTNDEFEDAEIVEVIDVADEDEETVLSDVHVVVEDVVEVVADDDIIEVVDDDFEDEVIEVVEEHEDIVEVVDEVEDVVEVVEEADDDSEAGGWFDIDEEPSAPARPKGVENELNDFLKGLD